MIFNGNYEIQIILFLVTYAYRISFWKYFETIILINSFG